MRVVLHIGTDKTGSTSIESALYRNRDWLRERSVYVPETGLGRDNGHALLLEQLHDGELASLAKELSTARDVGFARAIVSWEGMVRFRRTQIRKLFRALRAFDIQVLVYLRDQAEIIQSAHLQWIQAGRAGPCRFAHLRTLPACASACWPPRSSAIRAATTTARCAGGADICPARIFVCAFSTGRVSSTAM
ncbi:MAG: hypothetical protein U5K56_18485 [Halioglobus sp.]|nr:hypothetical protein [Halioglobus sp.]